MQRSATAYSAWPISSLPKMIKSFIFCLLTFLTVHANNNKVTITVVVPPNSTTVPLHRPISLSFHPTTEHLYIANMDNDSVTILTEHGATEKKDTLAYHYMTHVSGISFNADGTEFASCHDSTNRYDAAEAWDPKRDWRWTDANVKVDLAAEAAEGKAGNNNMGPSLWRTNTYAVKNQKYGTEVWHKDKNGKTLYGSHIDMLHQSPRCVGITFAHTTRVYYAIDDGWGLPATHGAVVRYDFSKDHGEGGSDHTVGKVHRLRGFMLTRVPGVASQPVFDHTNQMLYIADTGGGRIVKLDVSSGVVSKDTPPYSIQNHKLDEYLYIDIGLHWSFGKNVLKYPSGLALRTEKDMLMLFVSDYETSQIHIFFAENGEVARSPLDIATTAGLQKHGLSGLTFGPSGKLWAAHATAPAIVSVTIPIVTNQPEEPELAPEDPVKPEEPVKPEATTSRGTTTVTSFGVVSGTCILAAYFLQYT